MVNFEAYFFGTYFLVRLVGWSVASVGGGCGGGGLWLACWMSCSSYSILYMEYIVKKIAVLTASTIAVYTGASYDPNYWSFNTCRFDSIQ